MFASVKQKSNYQWWSLMRNETSVNQMTFTFCSFRNLFYIRIVICYVVALLYIITTDHLMWQHVDLAQSKTKVEAPWTTLKGKTKFQLFSASSLFKIQVYTDRLVRNKDCYVSRFAIFLAFLISTRSLSFLWKPFII